MSIEVPQGSETQDWPQNASKSQGFMPLKTKRTATIASTVVVVLLVFLAISSIVSSQRFVCASCHRDEAEMLDTKVHANASCYDCHLNGGIWRVSSQKSREWFVMYPRQFFGHAPSNQDRIAPTQIDDQLCLTCHKDVGTVTNGASTGISINHDTCVSTYECTTCHVRFAHGHATQRSSQLAMEQCQKCHQKDFRARHCTRCHDERSSEATTSSKAWRATHGKNWRTTHGMGNLETCSACHDDELCVKCHKTPIPHRQDFGATHGETAQKYPGSCTTCHKEKNFCAGCHGIEMPHPASFLKEHSRLVKKRGDDVCTRCHTEDGCAQCHAQHTHPAGPQTFKKNAQKANKEGGN